MAISLSFLINACSKDDAPDYNYDMEYIADGQTSYIQWFVWRPIISSESAGSITSIDGLIVASKVSKSSDIVPKISGSVIVSGFDSPHYELVAKIKFLYYGSYWGVRPLELVSDWQYSYGQFEKVSKGRYIFRIFELYDELPE